MGGAARSIGWIEPRTSQYSGKECVTLVPTTSGVGAFNVADVIVAPEVANPIADAGTAKPLSAVHGMVGTSIDAGVSLCRSALACASAVRHVAAHPLSIRQCAAPVAQRIKEGEFILSPV
jgi:hypothetical protein